MDRKTVENLAQLARIEVPEREQDKLAKDLESILAFVGQLKEVDAEVTTEGRVGAVVNVMREDREPHESDIHTETLLAEAPARTGNYLKVKKIL